MAQAVLEDARQISDNAMHYGDDSHVIAQAKLARLLELEARKRHGVLDDIETRERLQLRSTLRRLDPKTYQDYLSRRDEEPVEERPIGVPLSPEVRVSSRGLAEELQLARKKLSILNARRRQIDRMRLGSATASKHQHEALEAKHNEILFETDRLHDWLVSLGLYDEVHAEIRYIYVRLRQLGERRARADQLRTARRAKGQPWPHHWQNEFERIVSEIRNLQHRASQKKILIANSRSGRWS